MNISFLYFSFLKFCLEFKTKGFLCIFVTLATYFPFSWKQWLGTCTASLQPRLLLSLVQEWGAREETGKCFRGKGMSSPGSCCMCPVLDGVCNQLLHVGWEWDPQTRTYSWIPAQPLGGSRSGTRQLLSSIRMCGCLSLRCLPAHDEGASCSADNENYLFQIVLKKVSH